VNRVPEVCADSALSIADLHRSVCNIRAPVVRIPPERRDSTSGTLLAGRRYNERMPGSDDVRAAASRVKLTYEDFLQFPDDGKRHELIDGEHYVTPSPNTKHQRVSGNLYFLIRAWLEEHPVGQIFYAPFDVVFSNVDVVEPDLLYLSNERVQEVLTAQHVTGAPEIVVEIASKGTRKRDETIKRRLYERCGVSEYWVVDPQLDVVRVYLRAGEVFPRPNELSMERGDVLTSALLPGLELPLARVFGA
jgi:Uma2 family endonuclease